MQEWARSFYISEDQKERQGRVHVIKSLLNPGYIT